MLALGLAQIASPQINRTPDVPAPPPSQDAATVERPDFAVKVPRPNAPPMGEQDLLSDNWTSENGIRHMHGHVDIELFNGTFKADEAEFNEDSRVFTAHGHVYYRNYEQNEVVYADSIVYNTETRHGVFYRARGYAKTKVVARPGILLTQEPFYFEGAVVEKLDDKYVLYQGTITDCHVPHPWWVLRSRLIDIIPDDRAITHNATFFLRGVPVFYFPVFYKALKKEPRKSGFLTPEAGHSSQFGYFFGLGYYWAINRSYDVEYLFNDYTARGYAHHLDFRGKPTQKSDFNLIVFGVQDRGVDENGTIVGKAPGLSITGVAKTQFGDGWVARANIDYLSSFLFRQTFSAGFNEAVYSSTNSTAYLTKHFDYYTFNTDVSRNENFDSTAAGDSVIIRKLPEFQFEGRDEQIASGVLPAFFSFDTSFGLYHRVEPKPEPDYYETSQFTPRGDLEPTISTSFHWAGFSILPSFTMHETFYGQSLAGNTVASSALNRTAPQVSIDLVMPTIERIFDKKTFLGDKLKHVIEPRLTYNYVTGVNNFLNTLRFDSTDLLNDTNEVEIGLTNRIYAKKGDTVTEVFTWEFYQKFYFDPTFGGAVVAGQRNILASEIDMTGFAFLSGPRSYSPLVSVLRASPRTGVNIQWMADYDPVRQQIVNSSFSTDVRLKKYFVSVGNNLVRPNAVIAPAANQYRATFGYGDPNRKGWNSAFTTVYDSRLGIQEFAIAQVTYNTDCCGFSFELRRFDFGTRDDTQYRVAFSIANIGTFGNLKKQERIF
jgi:LPS-assembly protein